MVLIIFLSLEGTASVPAIILAGLMAFLFPPVVNHLALGQFSITAALCCLLAGLCAERRQEWPAAFLLALALTKPQLVFFAVLGLGFYSLHRDGSLGLLRFVLRLILAAFLLSLPVFIANPGWIEDWLANLQRNPAWLHPSLFTFLRLGAGIWAYYLWGLILLTGVEICRRLWRALPPRMAMHWTLGLTLLVSPYIWSWDFVLLLPAWIYVYAHTGWKRAALLLLVYLAGWAGMAAIQLSQDYNNVRFWWVPLWFMGALLAAGTDIKHKEAGHF